jgi:biopolymer transport protein ExbB/TolQ
MLRFFLQCGPYGWPLLILAIVNVVLIVRKAVQLFGGRGAAAFSSADAQDAMGATLESGLNAILFWGAISAVLGFLGQYSGIYKALQAIQGARAISPNVVAQGFAESFSTTLFGLTIFVFSAITWFVLYSRTQQLRRRTEIALSAQTSATAV